MSQSSGSRSPIWDPQEGPKLGEGWESQLCHGQESSSQEISPRRMRCQLWEPPSRPARVGAATGTLCRQGRTLGESRVCPTQGHQGGGHGWQRTATVTRSHRVATNSQQSTDEWEVREVGRLGAVPDPPTAPAFTRAGYWGATGLVTSMAGCRGTPGPVYPTPWHSRVIRPADGAPPSGSGTGGPKHSPSPTAEWGEAVRVPRMVTIRPDSDGNTACSVCNPLLYSRLRDGCWGRGM